MIILVKKTIYGYRAETVSRSLPTDSQMKRVNKFLQSQQTKENSFNTFNK